MKSSTIIICFLSVLLVSCLSGKREQTQDTSSTDSSLETNIVETSSSDTEEDEDDIDRLLKQGYWVDFPVIYTYHFTGTINEKYKFDMYLTVDSTIVIGHYNYLGHSGTISVKGTLVGNDLKIKEENGHVFAGKFDYDAGRITGTWTSDDGEKVYTFDMANPYGVGYPLRTYKVHLEREEYHRYVKSIQITDANRGTNVVDLPDDIEALGFSYGLYIQDYNFDGYLDISLVWMLPAYPPLRFKYLFYDTESKDYIDTDLYGDIYTLVDNVNFRHKTVSLLIEGRHYSNSIYKYQNNSFYEIYSEHLTGDAGLDPDVEMVTDYFKIVDGTTVSIDKEEYEKIYGE